MFSCLLSFQIPTPVCGGRGGGGGGGGGGGADPAAECLPPPACLSACLPACEFERVPVDPRLGSTLCLQDGWLGLEPRTGSAPDVTTTEDAATLLADLAEGRASLAKAENQVALPSSFDQPGLMEMPLTINVNVQELVINVNKEGGNGEVSSPADVPPITPLVICEEVHTDELPPQGGDLQNL